MKTWILGALFLLSGCATPPITRSPESPDAVNIQEVPFVAQARHHCGPASLAMLLAWSGKRVGAEELAKKMYSPGREGTLPLDVIGAVRREGFLAIPVTDFPSLFKEVAAGNPVMVLENFGRSWMPLWHYAVVTGYDLNEEEITLHSGSSRNDVDSLNKFSRAWGRADNWGIVVLAPGELSESGDEITHLKAVVGLERIGKLEEAEKGYRAILARWPESLGASIGLGNVRYNLGDAEEAALTLQKVTERHPTVPALWHNLALAQAAARQMGEARASARKAVSLVSQEELPLYEDGLKALLVEKSE